MSLEFQSMDNLELPKELPAGDGLELLLKTQSELNKNIYPIVLEKLNFPTQLQVESFGSEIRQALLKEYLLAIIRESCEALDLINSKPWKQSAREVNERELKFEIIDILHFWLTSCDVLQIQRNEILQYYFSKSGENYKRLERGY